ncbi:SMC family ATPase [Candidatus Bathyarchaeota archaeon]|nr:SMC family ATPase [Candidatus Bathyarchaeota archaeon]
MRIDSVFIENIRSHVKSYVKFSKGFNCLVGGLGAGKSSILYAIDFVLFGDPLGRSYEYLLREGADVCRAALKFIEGGKEYTIWRGLRRRGEHIVQDNGQLKLFEGDKLLAEMKNEAIAEQLKSIIGVDREIFREIMWVRQEKLKEILDMTPGERQRKMDQLFGISDYEISWTNLRPLQRWYEGERETLTHDPDVISTDDIQKKYDETVKELVLRDAELEEARNQIQEAEEKLKEASARLEEMKALRQKSEEMKAEETRLRAGISSAETLCVRLANEIRERKMKINDLEKRLESLNVQEENIKKIIADLGLTADVSSNYIQSYVNSIIEQTSSMQGEKEHIREEIKRAKQRISSLMRENRCPLCLQDLLPDYKNGLLTRLNQDLSNYERQMRELDENTKELERLRSIALTAFSSLQPIRSRKEEIVRQLEAEKNLLNNASKELEDEERTLESFRRQLADLHSRITEFDYSRLEDAQKSYNDALENYSGLKYKVQNIEAQLKEVNLRLENLRERLDSAQRKVERLEKVKRILMFIEESRQAYRSIQPKIRGDFIRYLERFIQQMMDELTGSEGPMLNISVDEDYTPIIEGEGGYSRGAINLSGGERTFLAFAYRLGIGQLVLHLRTGRGLSMLLLDEPTESLGREDGSIDRLAEILSRLKTVEQIIAVTHSEAFAEKADHVIRVEKRDGRSAVSPE